VIQRRHVGAPPAVFVGLAVLSLALFLALPLVGLVARAPWRSVVDGIGDPSIRSALLLSLVCSATATLLSAVFGIPLAWLLARTQFRGQRLVRTLATLPLVLPPVVGGVALLLAFGRRGLVGQWLYAATGFSLPFTTAGAILAETFVAMPFLVLTVEGAIRSLERGYEETAATLGAAPWKVFRSVTLPLIGPSLASGAALTWARALGEFGATITFAGNVQGRTQTLPLAVYIALETKPETAITLSLVLLAVSIAILAVLGPRTRATLARETPP
jgi:molybdate transport system permease protein